MISLRKVSQQRRLVNKTNEIKTAGQIEMLQNITYKMLILKMNLTTNREQRASYGV